MDQSNVEPCQSTGVKHTEDNDNNKTEGHVVLPQSQSRLPVRVSTPRKDSSTTNTPTVKKSKLPMRTNTPPTSGRDRQGSSSKLPSKIQSTVKGSVDEKLSKAHVVLLSPSEQIEQNRMLEVLNSNSFVFEPPDFELITNPYISCMTEIIRIRSDLKKFTAKKIEFLQNLRQKLTDCSSDLTVIPEVHLELLEILDDNFEELQKEILGQQIDEHIHNILSAFHSVDTVESKSHANIQIDSTVEDETLLESILEHTSFEIRKDDNEPILIKAKSDIKEISSSLKISLKRQIQGISEVGRTISKIPMKEFGKLSHHELENEGRDVQICDLIEIDTTSLHDFYLVKTEESNSEVNKVSNEIESSINTEFDPINNGFPDENYLPDGNNFFEESNKPSERTDEIEDDCEYVVIQAEQRVSQSQTSCPEVSLFTSTLSVPPTISNVSKSNETPEEKEPCHSCLPDEVWVLLPEVSSNQKSETVDSDESSGSHGQSSDFSGDELLTEIKNGLEKLRTHIELEESEVRPNDLQFPIETTQKPVTLCPTLPTKEDIEAIDHKSSQVQFNLFENLAEAPESCCIKTLTSEFIKIVKSDLVSDQNASIQECKVQDHKKFQLLHLLNAMDDLFSERQDCDCRTEETSLGAVPKSSTNALDVNSFEFIASSAQSQTSPEELVKVLEALDDFSNEKLEDLIESDAGGKHSTAANIPQFFAPKIISDLVKPSPYEWKDLVLTYARSLNSVNLPTRNGKMESYNDLRKGHLGKQLLRESISEPNYYCKIERILVQRGISDSDNLRNESYQKLIAERRSTGSLNTVTTRDPMTQTQNSKGKSALAPVSSEDRIDLLSRGSKMKYEVETSSSVQWNVFGIPMLADKILLLLSGKNMIVARSVNKDWYESISTSTIFWKKIKVYKVMDFQVSWSEFQASDLFRFKCPNFHILRCDLRERDAIEFFKQVRLRIKHLTLDQCAFSLATLQRTLCSCSNMEHFEIIGIPENILLSEAIFSPRNYPAVLKHLRTLILNTDQECYWSREVLRRNSLHPGFISDLLTTSQGLENVELIGWKSFTCMSFLRISHYSLALSQVNRIVLSKIPLDGLDFDHFGSLALLAHSIKLKNLELSLIEPQREFLHGRDYANLIVREIVRAHSQSLEDLVFDNCPITEEVFIFQMPELKKLSLIGTNIANTEFQLIMPKLENFNYEIRPFPRIVALTPRQSQDYIGSNEILVEGLKYLIAVSGFILCLVLYNISPAPGYIGLILFTMTACMIFAFLWLDFD